MYDNVEFEYTPHKPWNHQYKSVGIQCMLKLTGKYWVIENIVSKDSG